MAPCLGSDGHEALPWLWGSTRTPAPPVSDEVLSVRMLLLWGDDRAGVLRRGLDRRGRSLARSGGSRGRVRDEIRLLGPIFLGCDWTFRRRRDGALVPATSSHRAARLNAGRQAIAAAEPDNGPPVCCSCRYDAGCARDSLRPWYARRRPWRSLLNGRSLCVHPELRGSSPSRLGSLLPQALRIEGTSLCGFTS